MKKSILAIVLVCCLFSCDEENAVEKEIASIETKVLIDRFDQIFASATPKDLPELKDDYPFMFSDRYPDSFWIDKMNDSLHQELSFEVNKKYKNFDAIKNEISQLFQHLKYYFPEFNEPRVLTYVSEVKYRDKVFVTDTIALIALDTYLGEGHKFYGNIQNYLRQNFTQNQIIPDMAHEYAKKYTYQLKKKTLLEEMIYHGKLLYFKDKIIPFKTDEEKIGYTSQELSWAKENESEVWRYFVSRELLYYTDSKLPARFINPAPFSKFYLELDGESPGRLGQYIGWEIVRAYMKNNNVSLNRMLITDAETIFKEAKFKPRK